MLLKLQVLMLHLGGKKFLKNDDRKGPSGVTGTQRIRPPLGPTPIVNRDSLKSSSISGQTVWPTILKLCISEARVYNLL